MKISIAMATFNGEKYLQQQLDSFVAQSRQPDELVVCDDGSSDDTLKVLEAFRKQAPFAVRIYKNETNLGYTKNFEKAMSLCKEDIIFLSDQDDVWFSSKLSDMAAKFETHPDTFVLQADMVLTDEDLNPSPCTQLGNILSVGNRPEVFVTGCGSAIRREWLTLALPIPADIVAHDNWIHRLALALDVRVLHNKPLQYYRRHGGNASNWLASNITKITALDDFRAHGFRDARSGWHQERERIRTCYQRLEESTETLRKLDLLERRARALRFLDYRMQCLDRRIQTMSINRLRRLPKVADLWVRGCYRQFSGWKSAIKDAVR